MGLSHQGLAAPVKQEARRPGTEPGNKHQEVNIMASSKCDLCYQNPHIGNRIVVDWDGSWVRTCQKCLEEFGKYAISCSQGSISRAREIAEAEKENSGHFGAATGN